MYNKDLTEDFRLRLSQTDMDFLRSLSEERNITISNLVRSIIGEYRRSLETMANLKDLLELAKKAEEEKEKGRNTVHGNISTDIDD